MVLSIQASSNMAYMSACGEVAAHDGLVRHAVEVLHDAAQRVAVGCHQDTLAGLAGT